MNSTSVLVVDQLNPGMVVAEDVYDNRGHLIVSNELPISEKTILRFKLYSIERVKVYNQISDIIIMHERNEQGIQITESLEFQEFKQKYMESVHEFKDAINEIVYGTEHIDQKRILNNINQLILESSSKSQVFCLLRNLKQRDDETYTHSYNVAIICMMFGIWLNKSQEEIEVLTLSGLLHDIGKIPIFEELNLKREAELNQAEQEIMKLHTIRGYEILKNTNLDERVKQVACQHHERRNGSGYPYGLMEICEYAQIVAIADIYDNMTSKNRILSHSPFKFFDYFKREGYDLFESKFLLPFIEKTGETFLHNRVILTNGIEGEIILINEQEKSRPLIRTKYGFIDLNMERNLEIEEVL